MRWIKSTFFVIVFLSFCFSLFILLTPNISSSYKQNSWERLPDKWLLVDTVGSPLDESARTSALEGSSPRKYTGKQLKELRAYRKDDIKAVFRRQPYIVNNLDHKLLISPRNKCQGNVTLLMVALSQYKNIHLRSVIRKTWGAPKKSDVRLCFIFGRQNTTAWDEDLILESQEHHDIIQYDFLDTYENLVLKSLSILRWANDHCERDLFILKVDDDILMMTSRLYARLSQLKPEGVLLGYYNPHSVVIRGGRWGVSRTDFPFSTFPPYLMGGAYVMSSDVSRTLLASAKHVSLIPIEDVFITGILANINYIRHISEFYFVFSRKFSVKLNENACKRVPMKTIALHLDAPNERLLSDLMLLTYKQLSNCSTTNSGVVQSRIIPKPL
ncbi:beta-1,3-galactosyltransferase 5 [Lingula anatina]|uniref:Hexosyltransferase n=1 Tax=Lingula anatina TaxID=7574 RepID=A0A1S3JXU5_LINAN|nr:beta-1,3-galactosyltransferase 5 [Lingula anatina]|eukprot:XP_013414876.1 beta-1,3-galactosyltransferase 5 [Lingula anatina]